MLAVFVPFSQRRSAAAQPPTTDPALSTGILHTDRGDFPFTAKSWRSDGADQDVDAKRVLALRQKRLDAKTWDDVRVLFTDDSLALLQLQRPAILGNLSARTPSVPQRQRLTDLITVTQPDGSELFFARSVDFLAADLSRDPADPLDAVGPKTLVIAAPIINVVRSVHGVLLFDLPDEEHPVYEAMHFNEWDRFGLPAPPSHESPPAATKPYGT
jgi:hypothetical protein